MSTQVCMSDHDPTHVMILMIRLITLTSATCEKSCRSMAKTEDVCLFIILSRLFRRVEEDEGIHLSQQTGLKESTSAGEMPLTVATDDRREQAEESQWRKRGWWFAYFHILLVKFECWTTLTDNSRLEAESGGMEFFSLFTHKNELWTVRWCLRVLATEWIFNGGAIQLLGENLNVAKHSWHSASEWVSAQKTTMTGWIR